MYYLENIVNIQDPTGVRLIISYQPKNWAISNAASSFSLEQLRGAENLCRSALEKLQTIEHEKFVQLK